MLSLSFVNKVLLSLEVIILAILLLLSLLLLLDTRPLFFAVLTLAILSLVSLIYLMISSILDTSGNVRSRFVYLSHLGVMITLFGVLVLLIDGNGFKKMSPDVPFSVFSAGLVALVPYFHVMLINNFFAHAHRK